ncbi:MAG: methyltransferase domain-containing protein [Acidimicrobiia bacterium]
MARYTHGHHDSVLRSHRWRTVENSAAYLTGHLESGRSLLDVGCGPGTLTVDLAQRVAPGRVVGVDRVEAIVEQARADVPGGVANLSFEVGDVYALNFEDGTFDVVHAHQVLQHLNDPVTALREMRRVCRPGGVVAVRDADYGAMTWYPPNERLDRWLALYREVAVANGGQPDAGRCLLHWVHEAGLEEVEASASAWCFASSIEREWWGGLWADRIRRSSLADHAIESGLATRSDLEDLAAGWLDWAANPDAWFAVLHSEVVAAVS